MKQNIYIGDIRKCIVYDDEQFGFGKTGCCCDKNNVNTKLFKEQATLIKIGKYYIDIDNVENYFDCILLLLIKKNLILEKYKKEEDLYVDRKTLKPCNQKLRKFKK